MSENYEPGNASFAHVPLPIARRTKKASSAVLQHRWQNSASVFPFGLKYAEHLKDDNDNNNHSDDVEDVSVHNESVDTSGTSL